MNIIRRANAVTLSVLLSLLLTTAVILATVILANSYMNTLDRRTFTLTGAVLILTLAVIVVTSILSRISNILLDREIDRIRRHAVDTRAETRRLSQERKANHHSSDRRILDLPTYHSAQSSHHKSAS